MVYSDRLNKITKITDLKRSGYHLTEIPKGTIGEISKIKEEILEAEDAKEQGIEIMVLLELADAVGAIELYLEKHHPTVKLQDLKLMSDVTRRAFENGKRK